MSAVQLLRESVHERILAAAEDFLLQVEKGGRKARVPELRAMLTERLTAAGEQILAGLEETLAEYEDRVEQSEREICRQRRLLDAVMQPVVRLHRAGQSLDSVCPADVQQLMVYKEEIPPDQQQWSPLVDQEDPEPPHIKEEQEEPWTNQDGQQPQGLEETDIKFTLTPDAVKSEEDEEKLKSSKLHPSETKENRADCGGPEPARNSGPGGCLQPGPEDKTEDSAETEDSEDDWMETWEPQTGLNRKRNNKQPLSDMGDVQQLMVYKEEVPPEEQQWSPLVDQEDPEPPYIKEEQEEPWTNQDGQQLQGLEEADIKFTLTPVAVKSEEDEEKLKLSNLHLSEIKENRADCGGPEPARNSGPEDKTEDSSETEDSEGDWMETREPQTGLNRKRNNIQPLTDMGVSPADVQQLMVYKEEVPPEETQWSLLMDQEDPEQPHIKEEQEEPWTNQDIQQLQGLEEADIKFTLTPVAVKSEEDEEKLKSSKLHPSETKENRAVCGGPEPARNSGPEGHLQPGPEDKTEDSAETEDSEDDWMETWEPQTGLNRKRNNKQPLSDMGVCPADVQQLMVYKEEVPPDQQQWSLLVDQEDPEPPHIKEEQPWTNQYGQQLQGLEEADIKFTLTPVAVKSEEDEEKLKSSNLHLSEIKENRADCGGQEPARNSGPEGRLQPGPEDKSEDSSETEPSEDDWMETREPQTGLNTRNNKQPLSDMGGKTGKKSFSCSECGKKFNLKGNLNIHMRIHTGEKPFSCSECGKIFNRRANLNSHMRIHTGEKSFSCSECDKRYTQRSCLNRHMMSHTGEKPFSCSKCDKRYTQRSCLNRHISSHTGEKLFSCSECGKRFNLMYSLNLHMRSHTGEEPFGCSECGKRFNHRSHLNSHMRIHTGEKSFSCSECGKRFNQKGSLNIHMRSHTGEKPFGCSECGKRFNQKGNLNRHMRYHTGEKTV
ncbi:claspin-like isoform X2 [Limanda limanda]|uniref:claspin-like isoform X2 n=1 Tax=Limanda limanda TaxID=27771 RepID=UPI0029C6FA0B|nr:claspin-like isoform X2 [Limanda limanda]